MITMSGPARLRTLLQRDNPAVVPLALDPLAARIAEAAGFEALYVGGGAMGFQQAFTEATLSLQEMVHVAVDIRAASALALILDGTCGWGDPMHLHRTVALSEAAGFAAIEIEDQLLPKRAHHHVDIEHLIPADLMVQKIEEAVAARQDPDFVIIGRTNACRTDDLDEGLRRAEAYRKAGADVLLILATSTEQMEEIGRRIEGPLVCMPATGIRSLGISLHELGALGYQLVIDAVTPLLAQQKALRLCYEAIAAGDADPTIGEAYGDEMARIHQLVGLEWMLEIERRTVER
jgi:2-methylisocitrate lyase-like PEP mutase family enzyme